MRSVPPSTIEYGRIRGLSPPEAMYGAFQVLAPSGAFLRLIVSTGMGWDHVSVSLSNRCPTWEEMCWVKGQLFKAGECVMQLHPPKRDHINCHPYCLHLWRPQTAEEMVSLKQTWGDQWDDAWTAPPPIPRPPREMVGPRMEGK